MVPCPEMQENNTGPTQPNCGGNVHFDMGLP